MEGSNVSVIQNLKEWITIGTDFVFDALPNFIPDSTAWVGVVTDSTVGELYSAKIVNTLSQWDIHLLTIPDGETSKNRFWKEIIEDWLLLNGAPKRSCIVALGGGVIGDVVGFVASTYLRGVPVVQVPTSLLAMADSSVGGKTAVDVPAGKNMIGSFYHPHAVVIDTTFLETLPARHIQNGMAEVIKIAIALDKDLFSWLEDPQVVQKILSKDVATLQYAIIKAVSLKASVIEKDDKDNSARNILNAGHTVGHALEAILFPRWLHGECVAVGLVAEAHASLEAGIMDSFATVLRLRRCLRSFGLPTEVPHYELGPNSLNEIVRFAKADKKGSRGDIACVLLKEIGTVGEALIYRVDESCFRALLSGAIELRAPVLPQSLPKVALRVQGSKTAAMKMSIMSSLGEGQTILRGVPQVKEICVMIDALRQLGVRLQWSSSGEDLLIRGTSGQLDAGPSGEATIQLGNANILACSLLTACATLLPEGQSAVLSGVSREHPSIASLVNALRECRAQVEYVGSEGCFPIRVQGRNALADNARVVVDSSLRSEFLCAIFLTSVRRGATVVLGDKFLDQCCIDRTTALMHIYGVNVLNSPGQYIVTAGSYTNVAVLEVNGDEITSFFLLAWAAITGATVEVSNFGSDCATFPNILLRMGCKVQQESSCTRCTGVPPLASLEEVSLDLISADALVAVAVMAACARGRTRIVGTQSLSTKERNRICAVISGLRECGVDVKEIPDGIEILGRTFNERHMPRVLILCHNDYVVAMSFAILGCIRPNIVILDRNCIDKKLPYFFPLVRATLGIVVAEAPERSPRFIETKQRGRLAVQDDRNVILIGCGDGNLGRSLTRLLGGWRLLELENEFLFKYGMSHGNYSATYGLNASLVKGANILSNLTTTYPRRTIFVCSDGMFDFNSVSVGALVVCIDREQHEMIFETLSELCFRVDGELAENIAASAICSRLRPNCVPRWRVGRGTNFVSWTLPSYTALRELTTDGADAVEFRVDLLLDQSKSSVKRELESVRRLASGLPVIFTVRSKEHGGNWSGSSDEYLKMLEVGGRGGCEIIDVEACWTSRNVGLRSWIELSSSRGVGFIFSEHQVDTSPTMQRMIDVAKRCRAVAPGVPAILKIVMAAHNIQDCDVVFEFRSRLSTVLAGLAHPESPGFILILGGAKGRLTRIRSDMLTPCASTQMFSAAPGQITIPDITATRKFLGLFETPGRLCLFGSSPVASFLLALHTAALMGAKCDHALLYEMCQTESLEEIIRSTKDPEWFGGNLTAPFEESVFSVLNPMLCTSEAHEIGAVNVIWKTATGELAGDNSSWRAFLEVLHPHFVTGHAICIHGVESPTCAAALYAAKRLGAARIFVVDRLVARARALVERLADGVATVHSDFADVPPFQILISSLSELEGPLPVKLSHLHCVCDLSFSTCRSKVLSHVPEPVAVIEGWDVLLEQAVWESKLWLGRMEAPRSLMIQAKKAIATAFCSSPSQKGNFEGN